MASDGLLTSQQAQERLGVSRAAFWNLARRVHLPRYRRPLDRKRVFFKIEDLDRLQKPVRQDDTEKGS